MKTLYQIAEKVASFLNCSSGGSCGIFAAWVAQIAIKHNIKNFDVVFGHVQLQRRNNRWQDEHIWIEYEGEKIDPTVNQFEPHFVGYVGGKRKRHTPEAFLKMRQFSLKNVRLCGGMNVVKYHLKKKETR